MSAEYATNAKTINIIAPVITWPESVTLPLKVTCASPYTHRRAVFKLAQYFRREFHYDFVQYGYNGQEDDETHTAYLWPPDHWLGMSGMKVHCIGAACFRERVTAKQETVQSLVWIWLHPFFRRRGFLNLAWSMWQRNHGDFCVEAPLSEAMFSFLKEKSPSTRVLGAVRTNNEGDTRQ